MKTYANSKDIKVGVLGYGGAFNMGKQHLAEMKKAGMTPFAVCEIDPERLKVAKEDFPKIETYSDLDTMLTQSDVDLIVHITPHNLHFPLAAKCVRAGKHVVTEKPFVVTTAEADKLITLANKHDVMVSTYHNRHWDGWILRAKQQIDRGALGEIHRVELHMGGYGMPRDWWRSSRSVSGGILYDWGCHLLEYALQCIPSEITEVSGFAKEGYWESLAKKTFPWHGDCNEDEATAVVRFANGAHIRLVVSQLETAKHPPVRFNGTKGSYTINHFGWGADDEPAWTSKTATARGKITEKSGEHPKGKQHLFYRNIAEYLTGQADLIITPEWARRPIHILDLAGRSAKAGKALKAKHG